MTQKIKIELTPAQVDALTASAISMYIKLKADKYTSQTEIDFWYSIQDTLMMAKIRQTKDEPQS